MRQLAGLFPATEYPDMLVGLGEPDDAAVYRFDAQRALITTTDFFTPVVDDPWLYGAIAAANAMSDVYAMGGEVIFCLNIAGFPEDLPSETVAQIFSGGAAKVREAGAAIAGGHTVTSPEPFYGLSVTGIIHPDQVMRKGGAKPGDLLVLTKPLGTGVITTTAKLTGPDAGGGGKLLQRLRQKPVLNMAHLETAIQSMMQLNRAASQAATAAAVKSATDITGFGLLGHASEMILAGGGQAGLRIRAEDVPLLPGAITYAEAGYLTRGSTRNPDHYGHVVRMQADVAPVLQTLLWESETSGGVLLALPAAQKAVFENHCLVANQPFWIIGTVTDTPGIEVF